jgi:esterase/lipase
LEKQINEGEAAEKGIRPDCQARIVWADSLKKERTKLAILYIHGFSATQEEGNPVHRNLAKKYGANLYLARLAGHGIDLGDSTMATVTADDFVRSAEQALAVAKTLGDEVVVVGTSFGGALTTYLASQHPEIKAIVMYSPCIKIYDDNAELLDNPWGLELGKAVSGSYVRDFKAQNTEHAKYWSTHYHLNGVVSLQNFLTNAMNPETFAKVKCPAFMGYYYKNEEEQDKVVSVPNWVQRISKK